MWETLRRHDTAPEKVSQLVTAILKKIDGRVSDLAGSHSSSRVVQACIKHGTDAERAKILKQLEPNLLPLAKGPYGRFVVSKLIDMAPKESLPGKPQKDIKDIFYSSPWVQSQSFFISYLILHGLYFL